MFVYVYKHNINSIFQKLFSFFYASAVMSKNVSYLYIKIIIISKWCVPLYSFNLKILRKCKWGKTEYLKNVVNEKYL